MLSTYTLTVIAKDAELQPVVGAEVSVRLANSRGEYRSFSGQTADGTILSLDKTETTDGTGTAEITVFSNKDDTQDSRYVVTIKKDNLVLSRGSIIMPRANSTFHQLAPVPVPENVPLQDIITSASLSASTAESAATSAAADLVDAEKHAQEVAAFTDQDGASFGKGAKGWNLDTQTVWEDFQKRYIGPYAVAPTTMPDGSALFESVIYYNTTDKMLYVYNGTEFVSADPGAKVELQATATHVQWKYVVQATWTNLVPLEDIRGLPGIHVGDTPPADTNLVWIDTSIS